MNNGCFCKLGGPICGVLLMRALLFGVPVRPEETPMWHLSASRAGIEVIAPKHVPDSLPALSKHPKQWPIYPSFGSKSNSFGYPGGLGMAPCKRIPKQSPSFEASSLGTVDDIDPASRIYYTTIVPMVWVYSSIYRHARFLSSAVGRSDSGGYKSCAA